MMRIGGDSEMTWTGGKGEENLHYYAIIPIDESVNVVILGITTRIEG
jgi:hypothetical protein